MIITLTGADFSKSNIGILTRWKISTNLGQGAKYNGPTAVEKGEMLSASITVLNNYILQADRFLITMGGVSITELCTIEDNKIDINVSSVTGDIYIQVVTLPVYTLTIETVPDFATISINGEERNSTDTLYICENVLLGNWLYCVSGIPGMLNRISLLLRNATGVSSAEFVVTRSGVPPFLSTM